MWIWALKRVVDTLRADYTGTAYAIHNINEGYLLGQKIQIYRNSQKKILNLISIVDIIIHLIYTYFKNMRGKKIMEKINSIVLSVLLMVGLCNVAFAGRKPKEQPKKDEKKVTGLSTEETKNILSNRIDTGIKKLEDQLAKKKIRGEFIIADLGLPGNAKAIPILSKILLEYKLKEEYQLEEIPVPKSVDIRSDAAWSLGAIGEETIPVLIKAYETDTNKKVRGAARGAIFKMKLSKLYAVKVLPIPKSDVSQVKEVLNILMKDKDDNVKYCAASFLLNPVVTKNFNFKSQGNEKQKAIDIIQDIANNAENKYLRKDAAADLKNFIKGK